MIRPALVAELNPNQNEFVDFVLQQHIQLGYGELSMENILELIKLKYGTTADAKAEPGSIGEISSSWDSRKNCMRRKKLPLSFF